MSLAQFLKVKTNIYSKICKHCGKQLYNQNQTISYCKECNTESLRLSKAEKKNYDFMWIKIPTPTDISIIERNCDTCGTLYKSQVYIDSTHIQRHCLEHRNEYKRKHYLKTHTSYKCL